MAWDFYTETNQKARRDYYCDACEILINAAEFNDELAWDPNEWEAIEKARADKWRIKKGSVYTKISGKWDGDFSKFRARPEIDKICSKYDLYDN